MKVIMSIKRFWTWLSSGLERKANLLSAWASVFSIIGLPLIILGGYAAWIEVRSHLTKPDIVLDLEVSEQLRFRLINISPVILEKPQYAFSLWDLDTKAKGGGDDSGNLKIPVKTLEYIRPRSGIGPFVVESQSSSSYKVPENNIVFGWAYVQCPDCKMMRNYWVLYRKGGEAWYSEIQPEEHYTVMSTLREILDSGNRYPERLNRLIPPERRIKVRSAR